MTAILLTPGPLTTHPDVRHAMTTDYGSRDAAFTTIVEQCRKQLSVLALENNPKHHPHYPTTLLQGSGTFALEAMLTCFVGSAHHLLIMSNGAYGNRLTTIAKQLTLKHDVLMQPDDKPLAPHSLDDYLTNHPSISHVVFVHCETSTSLLNPLAELCAVARRHDVIPLIDAMSSFAIEPIDMKDHAIGALVASSNKGLEGVPGIAFVISHRPLLESCASPPSLVLNLKAQHRLLEEKQQFRFTPPVHVMVALHHALHRLHQEGGRAARHKRYQKNCQQLRDGLAQLGYTPYIRKCHQSPMIVAVRYPHDQFDFDDFYHALRQKGFIIYHGASTKADTFRVGCIGAITSQDIHRFLQAVAHYARR